MRGSIANEDGIWIDISVVFPFSIRILGVESNKAQLAHVTCQGPYQIQIEQSTLPKDPLDSAHWKSQLAHVSYQDPYQIQIEQSTLLKDPLDLAQGTCQSLGHI